MLAFFAVFEHLSNVRRLFNRFHILYTSPARSTTTTATKFDEQSPSNTDQRDILLGPILNSIVSDNRLKHFDEEFQEDLHKQEYFARELDACLLEMREIERDILNLKQRQCNFYERYLDFIEKKDQLTDMFIDYHDEYILNTNINNPDSSLSTKQSRKQSTKYEFNIPVSNRFELLKRQNTKK